MSNSWEQVAGRMKDMEQRLKSLEAQDARRLLTDYSWLRGWQDDFLGDSLHSQYQSAGNGSVALLPDLHGGVIRVQSGAVSTNWHALWLGDNADGHGTLHLDLTKGHEWLMIGKMYYQNIGSSDLYIGAMNAARSRRVVFGCNNTDADTSLVCQDGAGTTRVATGWGRPNEFHWFGIYATEDLVEGWIDGELLAECTTNIPTDDFLTPLLYARTYTGFNRSLIVDEWNVIPMKHGAIDLT